MTSFKGTAGATIKSGQVVYQGKNGLIYPLKPAGFFRRVFEWLRLVRRRWPSGLVLGQRGRGESLEVITSDVNGMESSSWEHAGDCEGMVIVGSASGKSWIGSRNRKPVPETLATGLQLYEVQLVGGPGDGRKSVCSHNKVYWQGELYVRNLGDDRYYWQPAAGGKN